MHKIALLWLLGCALATRVQGQVFKTGDKVCFVGNSITMNGGFFHQLALFYATRFPDQKVEFINCGINGNFSANVLSRMDSDILINKPNWAVLKLGMNDVRKELYHPDSAGVPGIERRREQALLVYRGHYVQIIERLLAAGCRIILQTPSIYDQTAKIPAMNYFGRNDALQRCSEIVRDLGLKYKLPVVDYQTIMLSVNHALQATDPAATLIGPDRVHPGAAGHFVMAYQFLKTMEAVFPQSAILLDLNQKSKHQAIDVKMDKGSVRFITKQQVLPFPVDQEASAGSALVPFGTMNLNSLRITGLDRGIYQLKAGDTVVGSFTDQQLDAGINLNVYKNIPQYRQSLALLERFREYWKLEADNRYVRLVESYHQAQNPRYVELRGRFNGNAAKMACLLEEIYRLNKVRTFHWTLQLITAETDLVAASQGTASPLFFDPSSAPAIRPSDFKDSRELVARNGMPGFFKKVKAGAPVTVAFIGGSVTQMDNKYRNQTARYLQELYPQAKMTFINAGVSGTGTDLGACRLGSQVLKFKPDLVFVEFAVNGSFVPGMEGIIRQIHGADPETGICLLYSISTGQSAMYAGGKLPENIQNLEQLADHYHLPSIHMGVEVSALEAGGKLVWKADPDLVKTKIVFSKDGTHPTTEGGSLYAAAIARSLLILSNAAPAELPFPAPLSADHWEDGKTIDPKEITFSSGWQQVATSADPVLKQFSAWFPQVMKAEQPGSSFSFVFQGTRVGLFDIGGPEAGQLEVYIDGRKQAVINRFNRFCNNRYRGQYFFIDTKPGEHRVEFRIAEQIPDKRAILGESQLEDIRANPDKYAKRVIYVGKILIKGTLLADRLKSNVVEKVTYDSGLKHDTAFNVFGRIGLMSKFSDFHGYRMIDFIFNGRSCKIVQPRWSAPGRPWVWRARFWGHEPQFDEAMLERGFHIVYCDVAELFGNAEAVTRWNKFYRLLRKAGLGKKAVLEGMSRGGVYVYNWAAENPGKVACIYADNPVLDLKSWPGGFGAGPGSTADWQKVLMDYNLSGQIDLARFRYSPIDKVGKILKGKYSMLHVCGDADEIVPMSENTIPFEKLVRAGGGDITVLHKPGFKHHPHSLPDPGPIVEFVMKAMRK